MRPQPAGSRRRSRGFILLESLIAFAILALMLAASYRIAGNGFTTLTRAESAGRVLDLMQSELDRLLAGPGLTSGVTTTDLDATYQAVTRIARVTAGRQTGNAILYRIDIAAYRRSDARREHRLLDLSVLRVERDRRPS